MAIAKSVQQQKQTYVSSNINQFPGNIKQWVLYHFFSI